jgi:copper resistance protein B
MIVQKKLAIATLALLPFGSGALAQTTDRDMPAMSPPSSSSTTTMPGMTMQDMPGMDMSPVKTKPVPARHQHSAPAPTTAQPSEVAPSTRVDHVAPSAPAPNDHVSPAAPQQQLSPMWPADMVDMMQMNDQANRGMWLFDRLEYRDATRGDDGTAWNAEGWWGNDLDKLWLKTEGEHDRSGTTDASADLLWGHATSTFWDWQLGARHDFGQGPSRDWAAVGVKGLAPYWFEFAATFYAGAEGRTAARLEAKYDLLFTQRLILSPQLELNFYGKDDPQRDVRSGLSEAEAGLRLRYEFSRRFAPYVGIDWTRHFAPVDDQPYAQPARETTFVAGVRLWF